MLSFIYGADEFVYVLGKCLINYGSVIGAGMYQSATAGNRKPISGKRELSKQADEEEMIHVQSVELPRQRGSASLGAEEHPPVTSSKKPDSGQDHRALSATGSAQTYSPTRAKLDWSKWTTARVEPQSGAPQPSENEQQQSQLREQIRGLRVDFDEDDDSILEMADIAGLDSVKAALDEFACFFLHFPHLTRNLRHRSTTGILLFGPQGTGKTLLVKSFAKKYNLAIYDVRASAIMSKFVGESEKFLRALFEEVRANTPSVLLLDECDGLLCNPIRDSTQSHNYRLLQNELKNQWSDLMYSKDEVIIIGVTNKPHDIDMDGFGRRLSLKLHVALPNEPGCQMILKGALDRLRHTLNDDEFASLGSICHECGLSGYDIDCLVEGLLRSSLRRIVLSEYFQRLDWGEGTILVPCSPHDEGAMKGPYAKLVKDVEDVSYRPWSFDEVRQAIQRAKPTVDETMTQKHTIFASQYATED